MSMKLKIETKSPVHIGTGNKYNLLDLYLNGKELVRVNLDSVFSDADHVREYIEAVDKKDVSKILEILKNGEKRYSARLGKDVKIEKIEDEINETIKDAHGDIPYIPGSSVKGAIRTALMISYLKSNNWKFSLCYGKDTIQKHDFWDALRNGIREAGIWPLGRDKYKDKNQKTFGIRFERLLVYTGGLNYSKKNGRYYLKYDAKYDIFKFIEISDFYPEKCELSIENLVTKVNGIFRAKELVEAIKGDFEGSISLSPQIKSAIENSREYPLLDDRLAMLGLTRKDITDLKSAEEKMVKHIIQALEEFVNDVAKRRKDKIPESANARIGYGIGTLYQGFWHYIAENLPSSKANEILLKFARHHSDVNSYPISRKILDDGQELGWVRIGV